MRDPARHADLHHQAGESCAAHIRAMLKFHQMGIPRGGLREQHPPGGAEHGVSNAFDFPGFVPASIRPLFCEGKKDLPGRLTRPEFQSGGIFGLRFR
jgi:urocanate hydratase